MVANELKIGNWVNWNGENGVVSQILEHEVVFKCGEDTLISELKPIKLTDQIIFNSGFYYDSDSDSFQMNYNPLRLIPYDDEGYLISIGGCDLELIKHVHQLQNLYFALTNQELEINL